VHFLYLLSRTACSVSIYLPALHAAVLCASLCMHSRPFHNSLSRLLTCAVNAPYLSSISLHLRGRSFMSSTYPPLAQRVCSTSGRSSWSIPIPSLFSVTLLPRLPLPVGLTVSYPPFYPMPQHTHVLHPAYRIPYIASSSLDLHSKKRLHFTSSAHHYISWTLFPPICFVRFALSSLLLLFLGIRASGKRENEVKSLLFIIVVICIFTLFRRERSGKKKKKN
jgi:hypothetical protein